LELLETKYQNVEFVKVNVDENSDLALELNIRTVPTVIIYDGQSLVERTTGANQDIVYTKVLDNL
jgi:thioredoxin 1